MFSTVVPLPRHSSSASASEASVADWQVRALAAEKKVAELTWAIDSLKGMVESLKGQNASLVKVLDSERQTANAQRLWGDLMVQRAAGVALQLQQTIQERPL